VKVKRVKESYVNVKRVKREVKSVNDVCTDNKSEESEER
jgi:hypothetical protein